MNISDFPNRKTSKALICYVFRFRACKQERIFLGRLWRGSLFSKETKHPDSKFDPGYGEKSIMSEIFHLKFRISGIPAFEYAFFMILSPGPGTSTTFLSLSSSYFENKHLFFYVFNVCFIASSPYTHTQTLHCAHTCCLLPRYTCILMQGTCKIYASYYVIVNKNKM